MSQIRAFVGHSFEPGDGDVVRIFLKFFDQIKGMVSGFSWEHAEPAEPKVLCEKVRRLIKDKNLHTLCFLIHSSAKRGMGRLEIKEGTISCRK